MPKDKKQHKYEVPLDGKLNTYEDPSKIGQNYQQLTNLRYTGTHPKGVGGMTKINTSVMDATYLKTRSAFHYNKDQPSESHVLSQAFNTGITASQILDNTAVVPAAGNFAATEIYIPTVSTSPGRFSGAPDGDMAFCDGEESCVWGGDEREVAAFMTSTAAITNAITNPKDYTAKVRNTLQTAGEVANIGGGNDSYTELLLHMDGADASATFTDSSSNNHTPTNVGAEMDVDQKMFGTASGLFAGVEYVWYADHANWDLSTGLLTIDFWVRLASIAQVHGFFNQRTDDTHWYSLWWSHITGKLHFKQQNGASADIHLQYDWSPVANTWYHISLVRGWGGNANDWAITVDGTSIGSETDSVTILDLTGPFDVGRGNITAGPTYNSLDGWIDEFRVSKGIARWEANFIPPAKAYAADTKYFLIGSIRPLQGCKLYVSDGNTEATPTLTGSYWNGNSWTTHTLTDNTTGLTETGTITWTSTDGLAKPKYLHGYYIYFYQFVLSAGYADIYYVTVDAPFQTIKDIWDGVHRPIDSFQIFEDSVYKEVTQYVRENDYSTANTGTFIELDDLLTASEYIVCGFQERMTAISLNLVASKFNITAATTTQAYYWNGAAWVELLGLSDGTVENSIALGGSGVISWSHVNPEDEFPKTISNDVELYYYKIFFDADLSNDVQVYYITGIPVQTDIGAYEFPLHANNQLWLCNNAKEKPNTAICSGPESSCVFNGDSSIRVSFGDETGLIGGAWLYGQYDSNLYNIILFYKKNEFWGLVGEHSGNWKRYKISDTIGCVAYGTIVVADLGVDASRIGLNSVVSIWQSQDGIYISDGRQPICISNDIKDKFDKRGSSPINVSKIANSYSFWDNDNKCYHWLWASGTSTTLNEEYVFDFNKQAWFNIDRTADLQVGITVKTTTGIRYNYGFIDTGYMERLEYGNDFDGNDIVHTLHTGDMVLAGEGSVSTETTIQRTCLIATAKTTTTADITMTHYGDGYTTGTSWTESPTRANYRVIYPVEHQSLGAHIFHSIKMTTTTDNETIGFEPLYFYMIYEDTREHSRSWR